MYSITIQADTIAGLNEKLYNLQISCLEREVGETVAIQAGVPGYSVSPSTAPTVLSPSVPATTPIAPSPSVPAVPTAEAPQYTLEQITNAGAQLVSMGDEKYKALLALMTAFGIQAATQLRPEQYGPFALELRKLGASI